MQEKSDSTSSNHSEAKKILIAMFLGFIFGLALFYTKSSNVFEFIKPLGDIFISLLRMIIVPLVFSSIFMSMYNLGTPSSLGKMGVRAMAYYFITTAVAVLIGIIVVNIINPGVGAHLGAQGLSGLSESALSKVSGNNEGLISLYKTVVSVFVNAVPKNPFGAMASGEILQVILFSIFLGITALYLPKESKPIVSFIESLEKMSLFLTHQIMRLAPIGIFVLMTGVLAQSGFEALFALSKYMSTVIIGLFIHACFLLTVASVRLKKSPVFIIQGLAQALITAFSTASSAATLPITIANVEDNLGVSQNTAKFVLPLGATVNMDGTALYESVAAIFIAQAYGIDLSIMQQMLIFLTASLAAIGAAAIPGAGLITMSIVLTAVKLPLEGIGLILAVDRVLDMFRTTVNVFGDAVGTIVVDSMDKNSESMVNEAESVNA